LVKTNYPARFPLGTCEWSSFAAGVPLRALAAPESKAVHQEDTIPQNAPVVGQRPSPDALLAGQVRRGDADACHRFFRQYYPDIYRYLLWLTERPEVAEDLSQETLVRAWRHLDTFDDRASLRTWLHRIAHREFLRFLRSRREQASLDEVAEAADSRMAGWTEAVELREVIRKLPAEEGEVMVLHYLQGYDCQEIAQIVGAPVSTVKYRLLVARSHLQRELGEGDLVYLNEPAAPMRQWAWLPLDQMHALESRLAIRAVGGRGEQEMERREFLRHATAGAVGLMVAEKDVVDERLTKKLTLAVKATALADLCAHLASETGIKIVAGASVADEKVTLFCKQMRLRDVMRQLSRPFGYTWLRSGTVGEYRYELVQDLKSQLLEEELRNRDRHEALLALESEIERYRPYLDLSPDEALARAKSAPPEERERLQHFGGHAWGLLQMYFRLSAEEQATLRAVEELRFSEPLRPGEQPRSVWFGRDTLPPELGRGVLQSLRGRPLVKREGGYEGTLDPTLPGALPPAAVPEARGMVRLQIAQSELGQFTLRGWVHGFTIGSQGEVHQVIGEMCDAAAGKSPRVMKPNNAVANARLAGDPTLGSQISFQPQPSCSCGPAGEEGNSLPDGRADETAPEPNVTTADVLEALHRATSLPIVADYYTRLYKTEDVSARNQPLFDALNRLADAMRLRWNKDGAWLQFRSTTFYDDRLKEVPNRLLDRWGAARRQQGFLTLDDLCEIAQLTGPQLDGTEMAEGAKRCWGLAEWEMVRRRWPHRPQLRFMAGFTPAQRQEAMSAAGLPFAGMPLAQQQRFMDFALSDEPVRSLDELEGAVLRVEFTQPGGFQWGRSSPERSRRGAGGGWSDYYTRWVIPLGPGPQDRRVLRPPVQAPTREDALAAVRRLDPPLREALFAAVRRTDPRVPDDPGAFEESQIFPMRRDLTIVYVPGVRNARALFVYALAADFDGQIHYRQR
jgi:RNA polymerase sigma-70 factor, ECF subfamily